LRQRSARVFSSDTPNDQEAYASNTGGNSRDAAATPERTCSGRWSLVASRCGGLLPLPRGAHKPETIEQLSRRGLPYLATSPASPQPTIQNELGSFQSDHRPIRSPCPGIASLPGSALQSVTSHLWQEPYAVIPLVRICAGGGPKGSSLPRPLNLPQQVHNLLRRVLRFSCHKSFSHTSLSHYLWYRIRRTVHIYSRKLFDIRIGC